MNKSNTAVLLVNIGSPDAPTKPAVRRYLTQFLNDKRVIDIPWLARKILVNLIIIPFRVKKSTQLYLRLWTKKGSPLIYLSKELQEKLQHKLGEKADVFVGMRYGNPGYKQALLQIQKEGYKKLIVLPLFPQHALSTTETAFVAVEEYVKKKKIDVEIIRIGQFFRNPGFIKAFAEQAEKYDPKSYDFVLFSYHGLPNRQDEKSQPDDQPAGEVYAYSRACCETTQLIAKEMGLKDDEYTIGFQSRLSKNWLTPFSDDVLDRKLKEGKKKILVLAPAFVTDCLETIVEIDHDYNREFRQKGGERVKLVESLNTEDRWVDTLCELIEEKLN
ncbi:ferrochelatase [Maribellus sp. YY47]|uniref:ferrochelatase n=1 Tax=Maribellus sp. YY47 TaxID=2929486 RepID=UPI00200172FB|nr:ferrochelatase [Maribellus sp. YY47]MCK3686106.1 ferrochelatase [Maribellus sp. YY47]